jgi:hypothetical protein
MMVHNTQNYWVLGLCPLSGILKTREQNVLETGVQTWLKKRNVTFKEQHIYYTHITSDYNLTYVYNTSKIQTKKQCKI